MNNNVGLSMFLNLATHKPAFAFDWMLWYKGWRYLRRDAVLFVERMLRNVGNHWPHDRASRPRRLESTATPPRGPQLSQLYNPFLWKSLSAIKVRRSGHQPTQPSDISSSTPVCHQEVKTQLQNILLSIKLINFNFTLKNTVTAV